MKVSYNPPTYVRQRRKYWSRKSYLAAMTVEPPTNVPERDQLWRVRRVFFCGSDIVIELKDGRRFARRMRMYPFFVNSTPEQRQNHYISYYSIFFDDLDDGVDIDAWRRAYLNRHL